MDLEVFAVACVPLVERVGGLFAGEEAWTLGCLVLEEGEALHPFVVAVTMAVVVAQVAVVTAEVVVVLEAVVETAVD